ncbi:MAG: cation:proton antiporter [Candidatus Doudnabacteria bacterium]|nr:cation:proton antiporter [Candidatus Doudnabacteria bacterium]
MDHSLFYQLTFVLLVAGLIALLVSLLKQPSVIAFILTGVLVGSLGYSQIHQVSIFSDLGEIGITLLLFMVGLELDMRRLRELGKVVIYTTLGHAVLASVLAFFLARVLGFNAVASVYTAIALTFSSTIIVVKILGEKGQLQSLAARVAIGCSIVEDFMALVILLFVGGSSTGNFLPQSLPGWQIGIITLVRALIFLLILAFVSKKILPWLLKYLGRSDELLLSFSLAWALGLAAFASLPWVGFSFAIGGFLAGLALANSEVHWEIAARVKSIRDFFIIIFFIVFGSQLALGNIGRQLPTVIVLSLFMIVINPLIILLLLGRQGYKPKTSFLVGVTTIPMSEFSFILVALGNRAGQLDGAAAGVLTIVGIVSIGLSSYAIAGGDRLYIWLKPVLRIFDRHLPDVEKTSDEVVLKNHIVLVGAHRMGQHIIRSLEKLDQPLVLVDINPEIVSRYLTEGFNAVCGDITESYIQDQVNLQGARVVISTVPNLEENLALLEAIKRKSGKTKPKLIFSAQNETEAKKLYDQEIDYALSPHFIGGQHLAKILEGNHNFTGLKQLRKEHLKIINT